jgi:hypothetical protein
MSVQKQQQQQQQQQGPPPSTLGHRATLSQCLSCLDAAGHVTLQAHGQAITRVVALAEQVRLHLKRRVMLLVTRLQVKRSRVVHQINTLDEVQQKQQQQQQQQRHQQQQQPRLTIILSTAAPTSSPLPPGYQPPSCSVDQALAAHVTSLAAAAASALHTGAHATDAASAPPCKRLGRRVRAGQQLLPPLRKAKTNEA